MTPVLYIIGGVIAGLFILFAILKLIFSGVRKKLDRKIRERFAENEIFACTTRANFFGVRSQGGKQVRGNGALVLTSQLLVFIRAVPQKEYKIPLASIEKVTLPKSFNGKSTLHPLLCVKYQTDAGQDAMAWTVKNTKQWKYNIEKLL